MNRTLSLAMRLLLAIVALISAFAAGRGVRAADELEALVRGRVKLKGPAPALAPIPLDETMQRHTGRKTYTPETWIVGADGGLANVVVWLKPKTPNQMVAQPLPKLFWDRVDVRYVPHVLVATPGTEIVLRNKVSPCKGFSLSGLHNNFSVMVHEGQEYPVKVTRAEICSVGCLVRPYANGHLIVVDTPYFALTDDAGRFEIRNVRKGEYRVFAYHEAAGRLPPYPDRPHLISGPKEVVIASDKAVELQYEVTPPDAK